MTPGWTDPVGELGKHWLPRPSGVITYPALSRMRTTVPGLSPPTEMVSLEGSSHEMDRIPSFALLKGYSTPQCRQEGSQAPHEGGARMGIQLLGCVSSGEPLAPLGLQTPNHALGREWVTV